MKTITDTYEIEKYMRQRLDGNFWAINFEGKVIHCNVPKDFKPTFKRYVAIDNLDEKARAASFRIEWTQEHFRRIESMRIKGWSWKKVGQHIGGSESSTSEFYRRVIREQNADLQPHILAHRVKIVRHMIEAFISPRFVKMYMGYDEGFIQDAMRGME